MKKTVLALTLAALAVPAFAQDKKAPEPNVTISGNFGLVTDYRFRGISQTNRNPAIQGGFDLNHKSGVYLGTWASNVSEWANPGGSMELDFYGGLKGELPAEFNFDMGGIVYQYPGNAAGTGGTGNTTRELYIGLLKGPFSYKFSKTLSDWFGIPRSSGSIYHDITMTFPLAEKVSLVLHGGKQDVAGTSQAINPDYIDYSVGFTIEILEGYVLGLKYTNVDLKNSRAKSSDGWFNRAGTLNVSPARNQNLADDAFIFSISKTF